MPLCSGPAEPTARHVLDVRGSLKVAALPVILGQHRCGSHSTLTRVDSGFQQPPTDHGAFDDRTRERRVSCHRLRPCAVKEAMPRKSMVGSDAPCHRRQLTRDRAARQVRVGRSHRSRQRPDADDVMLASPQFVDRGEHGRGVGRRGRVGRFASSSRHWWQRHRPRAATTVMGRVTPSRAR